MFAVIDRIGFDSGGSGPVHPASVYRPPARLEIRPARDLAIQQCVAVANDGQVEILLDTPTRLPAEGPSSLNPEIDHRVQSRSQTLRLFGRDHFPCVSDNESGVAHVGYDARNSTSHRFANNVWK